MAAPDSCGVADEGEQAPSKSERFLRPEDVGMCVKCKTERPTIRIRITQYCRACFLRAVRHKYKYLVQKHQLFAHDDRVLVAYSGGQSSSCLLSFIKDDNENEFRRARTETQVLFVDEGAVLGWDDAKRSETTRSVEAVVTGMGFRVATLPLEASFDLPLEEARERLRALLASATPSTREDVVDSLRWHVIIAHARSVGCAKIVSGETASRLANATMTLTIKGRGATLPPRVALRDERFEGIAILRPLREMLGKEVALYNRLQSVPSVFIPTLATMAHSKTDIDHMTEEFLAGLQDEFPATVNTVARTAGKIDVPAEIAERSSWRLCCLCDGLLTPDECRAVAPPPPSSCCGGGECGSGSTREAGDGAAACSETGCSDERSAARAEGDASVALLQKAVCYACRNTLREVDARHLPPRVSSAAASQLSQQRLRAQVAEFLLDDDA